jgi:hypothetical protein
MARGTWECKRDYLSFPSVPRSTAIAFPDRWQTGGAGIMRFSTDWMFRRQQMDNTPV